MSTLPVLELKTKVEVDKSMKLIDINGKKINFQSDCIVHSSSQEPFHIAIVNQEELDNGQINFEIFNKSFSRRVRYESENNEHVNHYIVFKKLKDGKDNEKTIPCDIVIRLTELPMALQSSLQNQLQQSPLQSQLQQSPLQQSPLQQSPLQQSQLQSPLQQSQLQQSQLQSQLQQSQLQSPLQQSYSEIENTIENDNSIYRLIAIICFIVVIGMVIFKK